MLALCGPAEAIHRETPFLVDMSDEPGGFSTDPGPARGLPTRVAFESTSDLMGNGSTGSEIYLYVLSPDAENARTLGQITNFAGDSNNPASSNRSTVVAFDSLAQIIGSTNGTRQVYLWFRTSNSFVQMTRGSAPSENPAIDYNARVLAFESDALLRGSGGPGIGRQIFVYDLTGGPPPCTPLGCAPDPNRLFQVTNVPGTSSNPAISKDGDRVYFQSDGPVLGASNGFSQIYVYDLANGGAITQITSGLGDSRHPGTDPDGQFVVFESEADLLGNGSSGRQIFMLDIERDVIRQVTRGPGESFAPSLGEWVGLAFLSNGDLLGNGTSGQHLFFYEPRTNQMFQVTKDAGTVSDNPVAMGNFIVFDTDEDLLRKGMTGVQVFSMNSEGRITKPFLGKKDIDLVPEGRLRLDIGTRDQRSEAPIDVSKTSLQFPPLPSSVGGVFCLSPTADGAGYLSCGGGRPGGDLLVTQDHMTDDIDPTCVAPGTPKSCREGGACRGQLPSPHFNPCPACIGNVCSSGPNVGQACSQDATCVGNLQCVNGELGVCNGPVRVQRLGAFKTGGAQLSIPVSIGLSLDAGIDGKTCTSDDQWAFQGATRVLELTTGSATGAILDADTVAATDLIATATGTPFDCLRLEQDNFQDVRLVGLLPLLDVPTPLAGVRDLILPVELVARAGKPFNACVGLGCQILTYCDTALDCDDGNICNGVEACVANSCAPGVSLVCSDGNACNGQETCDGTLGCVGGSPLTCDDGTACTIDACTANGQCSNTFIPGCCAVDADCVDNNVCNGAETCVAGNCLRGPGMVCNDGNACNGVETCSPSSGCQPSVAPDCDDGARCTFDSCDAIVGCSNTFIPGCCSIDADCRDNTVCNGLETCGPGGNCLPGLGLSCDDGDACNGAETCDPGLGCQEAAPLVCNDGAICTLDSCDPLLGCVATSVSGCCNVDADCRDTNACNGLETCLAGECLPGAFPLCGDLDVCNGVETCDLNGTCLPGLPLACVDDGAVCTNDMCDAILGCVHVPIPGCCVTDADCLDNNMCNGDESCVGGDCFLGVPLACDDGDICNGAETCDPVTGCVPDPSATASPFSVEGIQCSIAAWSAAVEATSVGDYGSASKKRNFVRRSKKVRKQFGFTVPDKNGVAGRDKIKPRQARKNLFKFAKKIDRLITKGKGNQAAIGPLADMARDIMVQVDHFMFGVPDPEQLGRSAP
jgi:hypothetical protein